MPSERMYGDTAATHRALLSEEEQELYDWFTARLLTDNDAIFYNSLLQAVACRMPAIGYWSAVKAVKGIVESIPDFAEFRRQHTMQASQTMNRKTD